MARKYSEEEVKQRLHRATYELVTHEGIEGVTFRKVAEGCNLSTPYIYQCYRDMPALLTDAFIRIDMDISNLMHIAHNLNMIGDDKHRKFEENAWLLWSMFWKFLMEDPERTVFYWRFYQSGYYNDEILTYRRMCYKDLTDFVKMAGAAVGAPSGMKLNALLSNIIDSTVMIAVKLHLGYIDKDVLTTQTIYQSVFAMLFYFLGIDIWKDRDRIDNQQKNDKNTERGTL